MKTKKHAAILDEMHQTYVSKQSDYGDSFGRTHEKYGEIAGLIRISDKFNRVEQLIVNGNAQVKNESVQDSLIDMANYCVMLAMELEKEGING